MTDGFRRGPRRACRRTLPPGRTLGVRSVLRIASPAGAPGGSAVYAVLIIFRSADKCKGLLRLAVLVLAQQHLFAQFSALFKLGNQLFPVVFG